MFYDIEIIKTYLIDNIEADSEDEARKIARYEVDEFSTTSQTIRVVDVHEDCDSLY